MKLSCKINLKNGFSLVEIMLSISVFLMIVTGIATAISYIPERSIKPGNKTKALFIAQEGLEAVRNIRDNGFSNISNGIFGLGLNSNQWSFTGTSDSNGNFTRNIEISTVDATTKKIKSTVTWSSPSQETVSLETYLTDWVTASIINPVINWTNPIVQNSTDLTGLSDGLKVQVQGNYAYIVRNDGTPDFMIINISNPAAPAVVGSLSLSGIPTNIAVSGNFAYISSQSDTQELQIINISNPVLPMQVGSFNASGTLNANGVFVVGDNVYLTRSTGVGDEFLIINVTNRLTPTLRGSLNLDADSFEVVVLGSNAYIASGNNSQELQVINLSNLSSPTLQGFLDLSGNTDAYSIAGFDTTIVISRQNQIFTINVANPALPTILGNINTGTVNDISLGNNNTYAFLGTNSGSQEFQVINISNPSLLTQISSLNIGVALKGLAYDSVSNRAYAVSDSDTKEFIVLMPQ